MVGGQDFTINFVVFSRLNWLSAFLLFFEYRVDTLSEDHIMLLFDTYIWSQAARQPGSQPGLVLVLENGKCPGHNEQLQYYAGN